MRLQQTCRSLVAVAQKPAGPDRVAMSPRPLPQCTRRVPQCTCRVLWKQRTGHSFLQQALQFFTATVMEAHGGCSAISLGCGDACRSCTARTKRAGLGLAPLSRPCEGGRFSAPVQFDRKQNAQAKGAKRASSTPKWLTLPLESRQNRVTATVSCSKDFAACHQD